MADPKEQFGFVADEEPKQEEFGFVADTQPSVGTQSPEQQRVASVDESDVGLDRATSLREDQTPIRGQRNLVSTQIEPPPAKAPSQAQQELTRTIPAQTEFALRPKRKATEFGFIPDKNPTTQAELDKQTYGEHEYRPVGSTQVRPAAGSAPVSDMDLTRSLKNSRSENPLTSSLVPDVPREDTNALGMTSAGSEEERARLSHDVDEMFENEYGSNVRTMSGVEGYKPLAEGAGKLDLAAYELATGQYGTTPKEGFEAGHEAISGGFTAATPLMLAGGGIAPVATAVGLAGSVAGSKISEYAAKKMGATPEAQQLAADIGTFIPGIAGAAFGIRGSFRAGFDAEGNPIGARTISAAGDRVAAGYAQTPEGIHVAGKVGPYKAGVTIPFGGSEPGAPELMPGQGQLPSAPISEAQMRMQSVIQDMTATQAGVTPPSQVPPPPPGPQQLTPEIIEGVGTVIASLPQAAREPAILEAHQNLAKWMIARGNFVGPDGQVYTVATEAQANKLAAKWVNEQIAEHDKGAVSAPKKTLSPTQTKSDEEILEQFRSEHGTQMEGGADLGLHNLGRNVGLKTHDFAPEGTPELVKQALNKGYEHTGETTLAYPGSAETQPEGQPAHTFTKDGKRYFLHTDAKSADEMKELPSGASSAEEDDGVDHRAAFRDAYTKHLEAAIDKNPTQYAYSKDKVPDVVEKMIDALAKGTANRESPAIRATLKELGIPNKAAVIKRFFAQPTKTRSDLAMERIAAEDAAERRKTAEPLHKFATTQVNLPEKTSAAVKALAGQIPDAHLAGEGRTTQAHVTVRYGLKGDDFEAARAAIEKHAPFKAKFGRTDVFPPSEHSDNAAVVHAPVEAPELKQMHEAIGKATPVKNSDFEYKPHATIAYVKPEHAAKYKGMRGLEGQEFNVDRVHIADRNGKEIEVPLKGAEAGGHPRIGNDAWVSVPPALFDRFKSHLLSQPKLFDQEHITVKAPDGTHLNLDRYENNTWFVTAWGESDSGTYGGSTMSKAKVEKTIRSILKGAEDATHGGKQQGNDQLEHRGADTGGAPAGAGGSDRVPQGGGKEAAAKSGAGLFVSDVDLEAQRQKANEAPDTATRKREQSKYTRLKSQDTKAKLKYFTEELGFDKVEHGGGFGLFDEDEKVSRSLTEKQVAKIWRNHKEGIEPTDDDLKFEEPLTEEQRAEKDKRIAATMLDLYRQRAKGEILDTLTPAVKATQAEYPEASFGGAVNHNQYLYEQFVRPQLIKEGLADSDEQIAAKAKQYRENLARSEKFAKKSAKVMQMFRDAGLKPIGTTNSESLDPAKIDVAFEHPDHPGATAHMMLDEITSADVLRDKMADLLAKNKASGAPTLDDIKARLGLKPVDVAKAVEGYHALRENMDTFEQKYDALGRPKYVSADLAKELVEGWKNQTQRAELSDAVHKESSLAARDLFYRKLARVPAGDRVQFLTGPVAAGKTTYSQEAEASLTFETNLASPKHAKDLIDRTLAQGARPVITYVYTTPEKSVLRRATRMVEDGRPSSIEYSTPQHIELPKTLQQLVSEYGDKISVKAIDNSGDQPVEIPIEDIGGKAYNDSREKLLGKQQAELDRLKSIGAIPERIHQALSRRSAPADIREGHGEPAQSSRTGAVQASPAREVVSREPFSLEPGPEDIGTQGIMDRLRRDSSGESLLDRNLTAAEELIKARDEDVWREMGNLEDLVTGEYGEAVGADKVWSTSTDAAELSKALHDVVERLHDKDRDNEVYDRDRRMLDTFDGKDSPPAGEDYWEKVGGTMAAADVFPAPESTVRAADLTQNEVLSAPRAQARIDQWKAEAKRIGKEEDHSNEVVISLFDRTGIWSKPYRDAGYAVLQYDVENGDDLLEFLPTADILEARESGKKIVGVLAAPPCTSYAVSGARWWESQHDKANVDMVEKKYGFRASKYFDTPLDYANALVAAAQVVVELAKPELFHVLENPIGRIASQNELPKPTFTFDPSNFGDPYTKKTQLWGKFNTELPTANVEPTKGSFIATLRGDNPAEKLERSKTPEGFAYAFFMANHGAASAIIRGAGEADAAGNAADQTGRALAASAGEGAEPLEGTHPEVLPATVGQGAPQSTPGRGSRPDGELNAGLGEESQPLGARSGEGDSERELAVPRREVEAPAVRKARAPAKNNDWFAHPKEFSADATEGQRLKWNMDALRLLKQLETDDRMPTEAERETLAHYVGWGALQNVFDPYRSAYNEQKKWIESSRELSELMTEDEFDAARKSTVNAHYTSPEIVRFMWKAMQRIGFKDGQIFEPSMGIGNFLGMMPGSIRRASSVFGNDLDKTSYKIAKYLYPSAGLYNLDYAEMVLPDNAFDLAISNVPFGDYKLFDRSYPKLNALIHDFFFIKTLDKINPGGVMAFITSDGTLDKKTPRFREMMADKADLVAAFRFPRDAFKKNAGTQVVTDLIILRKRAQGDKPTDDSWTKLGSVDVPYGKDYPHLDGKTGARDINQYYVDHPDHLLGKLEIGRGMYGQQSETMLLVSDGPLDAKLEGAIEKLPRNLLSKSTASPVLEAGSPMVLSPGQHEDGTFVVHNGEVRVAERGALQPLPEKLNRTTYVERLKHAIELRDQVKELISDMLSSPDDEAANGYIQTKQKALKRTYDQYVKRHGFVSEKRTKDVFENDPYYPLVLSLEEYDRAEKVGTPTEIFTARTIYPPKKLTQLSPDPKEALYQVLNERGKADLDFMQELSGKSKEELLAALQKEELLFHNPLGGDWEMRDRYLSGYVREKLKDAEAAVAQGKKEYQANVDALKKVIPRDLTMDEIAVVNEETEESGLNLGATWIPPAAIEDFARTKLGAGYYVKVKTAGGAWSVKNAARSAEITGEFAGGDWDGDDLLQAALNQKQPTTYDTLMVEGKEVKKVNQDKTIAAREAMRKIKRAFRDHIVEHPKWAPDLAAVYNEKMRGLVTPSYDGSHLTFPGMNPAIKLRAHQANAIWRVIMEGRALLAHVVGAGKTYEMIAAAMEMKRLGMIRKAMFAVPNHLTGQWAGDFQRLYPGSRVLMPGKKDFDKINRNRTMARIATGNWDAIVLPHSQFNLMDISAERMRRTMQHEFDELEETLAAAREEGGKRDFTVKQLEKAKARLEARMSSLNSLKADTTIKFDDLGVDHLFVDEAHEYKNLTFYSKMGNISGLPRTETKKTLRLKAKTDYLLEKQQNRGVVFATGTPIANTMAEMYHMTRYLAPDVLEKAGIRFFDDWAANFGRVIPIMELSADGRTYRSRNKFAQFANVPELLMMFHSFADVKTAQDLNLPVPKIEGGRPQPITAPSNNIIEPYIKQLVRRAKIIRGESVEVLDDFGNPLIRDGQVVMRQYERPDPSVDNMLKVTGEGRKIATDPRLINPALEDYPKSKTNMVVDKIYGHWFDPWARKNKATGLVFLDNYQHLDDDGDPDFNLYHDMRDKLIARGVPAAEIAIVHDYGKPEQKQQLFDRMNAGEVRIMFGSTQKMGAGMNVQRRLKWLIDMDSPWKPGELEQRHGRLLRQGNMFFDADPNYEVALHHAITEGSFDTYMLQTLEGKAEFIQQVMSGNYDQRFMTDAAGDMVLSLEELKAIASGNPDVKLKMELESEVAKLRALKRQFQGQIRTRKYDAQTAREMAAVFHAVAAAAQKTLETWEAATAGEKWHLKVLGRDFEERSKASEWLKEQPNPITNFHIEFNGLHVPVSYDNNKVMHYMMPYAQGQFPVPSNNLAGLIPSIEARMRNLESSEIESSTDRAAAQLVKAEKLEALSSKFDKEAKLGEKEKELDDVNRRLGISDAKAAMEQEVNTEAGTESEAAPETEDGDEPVADLAPEGYSADAPLGRELHYDPPPSADQPGIVTVNVVDALALPAAMNVPPFHGVSLAPQDAVRAAARLRKDDAEVHPGIMAGRRRVAAILDMAAKDAGDAGVIVMVDSGNSQRYQRTLREEMFHATQRVLGLGEIRDHITDPGALVNHPVTRKVLPALAAKGYENWDDAIVVSELAAKIAAGQPEIFEYITAEEAADWYIGYLDQIEARAGLEGVDKIKKAVAMHDAAMSIFDAAQERRRTRSEENAKRAQQPTEAGTGLARDEEIGRNLPQQPKAPASSSGGGSNPPGGKKAGAVASTRQVPVFYSQLYRAIDAKMPNVATSAQVRAIVANPQNGVKPDEAKWLGLDEFLADKPKVGKEEVLDFIRQNQVQVKEIRLTDPNPRADRYRELDQRISAGETLTPAEMRELNELDANPEAPAGATKFGRPELQLPGGKNYGELLLTLPTGEFDEMRTEIAAWKREIEDLKAKLEQNGQPDEEMEADIEQLEDHVAKLELKIERSGDTSQPFTSGHYADISPNTVAHVRYSEYTDADGKRVLVMQEVQSDWHQLGRKRGYSKDTKGWTAESLSKPDAGFTHWQINDANGNYVTKIVGGSKAEAIRKAAEAAVPDAPFKKTWPELAIKTMLRYAAEKGYDKLAWTTGEQQATRYDLSKQVDEVIWTPTEEGRGELTAWKNKQRVIAKEIPQSELADHIGKDVAERLVVAPQQKLYGKMRHVLAGQNLKVGGKGMLGFYDKIIPTFLNKYAKKWGAKVGETKLGRQDTRGFYVDHHAGSWRITSGKGDTYQEFNTEREAMDGLATMQYGDKVHSIDITPAMKDSVLHEGQPLFNLAAGPAPDKFKFEDEDVAKEIEAARGLKPKSTIEKLRELYRKGINMATRKYEQLPRGNRWEPMRFRLTVLEHQKGVASDAAARHMAGILDELDETQYFNFSVKVLLDDLKETAADNIQIPFYNDLEVLDRDHAGITAHVAKDAKVKAAVDARRQIWAGIKDRYSAAMNDIGFKTTDRLKRDSYYRHQVLMYANGQEQAAKGTGSKLKTPTGRGFLKERKGSNLPINTDYLQAEHEVMAQMLFDIEVAKAIKFVDTEYNVAEQLKREAVAQNEEGVMDLFKTMEQAGTIPDGKSAEDLMGQLNKKQAIAFGRLQQMAAHHELPEGADSQWAGLIEALANNFHENLAQKELLEENWTPAARVPLPPGVNKQLFAYAGWLLKTQRGTPGAMAAGSLFKGIAEKKAAIKTALGSEHVTWKQLIPDGYRLWQPREGSLLYFTKTIPEHVVDELQSDAAKEIGITQEMLRSVLAKGGRFREFVVPDEIGDTLDNLRKEEEPGMISSVLRPAVRAWKIWTLISPRRWFKYNFRNLSGDAEPAFVGNPSTFGKMGEAASDLWDYYHAHTISPKLDEWLKRGGTESLLQAQEIGDINNLKMFARLHAARGTVKELPIKAWQGYWKTARMSTDFRESILRYSAFLDYYAQIARNLNKLPDNFGASIPDEVRALPNAYDRAFKLSNDLLGAYDDLTALGRELRQNVMPFWSFQEVNMKRAWRLLKNAGYDPKGEDGSYNKYNNSDNDGAGWDAWTWAHKTAGAAARKSPFLAYRLGKMLLKIAGMWALLSAWNHLFFSDEEHQLSDADRARPHMIFGHDKGGSVYYLPRLGSFGEILDWFGLDAPQQMLGDWLDGRKSGRELASDMFQNHVNKWVSQVSPTLKAPFEFLAGVETFPNVFHPRTVRDRAEYLARQFNLQNEYRAATGKPGRGYVPSLAEIFFNRVDKGSNAYYGLLSRKHDWLEQHGKGGSDTGATPRSEALRNWRLAAHMGDEAAYIKYSTEYFALGGTAKGIRHSMAAMHPLYGLSSAEKIAFVASLGKDGQQELSEGLSFYYDYLDAGMGASSETKVSDHGVAEETGQASQ